MRVEGKVKKNCFAGKKNKREPEIKFLSAAKKFQFWCFVVKIVYLCCRNYLI